MTENALTAKPQADLIDFDENKVALIKRTIAKGATDDELALFLHQARRSGLDPLARQIHFSKYNTKNGPQIAVITAIDGYRLIADRTGRYAGNDDPVYTGRLKHKGLDVPAKATVTVWKLVNGERVPFTASAYWAEYCPEGNRDHMWVKMPHVMLGKCAEAAALRKAFPADLSGIYTQEEMAQAEYVIDNSYSQPEQPRQPAKPQAPHKTTPPPSREDVDVVTGEIVDTPTARSAEDARAEILSSVDFDDKRPASEAQLKFVRASLSALCGGDNSKAKTVLGYLFQLDSSTRLTSGQARALIEWSGSTKENGYTVSPVSAQEAERMVVAAYLAEGQAALFDDAQNGAYAE